MIPSEGGEGGFAREPVVAKDWPGDFFFLRVVTFVGMKAGTGNSRTDRRQIPF